MLKCPKQREKTWEPGQQLYLRHEVEAWRGRSWNSARSCFYKERWCPIRPNAAGGSRTVRCDFPARPRMTQGSPLQRSGGRQGVTMTVSSSMEHWLCREKTEYSKLQRGGLEEVIPPFKKKVVWTLVIVNWKRVKRKERPQTLAVRARLGGSPNQDHKTPERLIRDTWPVGGGLRATNRPLPLTPTSAWSQRWPGWERSPTLARAPYLGIVEILGDKHGGSLEP